MSELASYLAMCAKAGSNMDAFVLEHGMLFKVDPETFKGRRGKQGKCFMNATLKAISKNLIYCEGYILVCGIPIHHGWCVTKDGTVIDPTIDNNDGRVADYYGVPFTTDYLIEAAARNGVYGLLGFFSKTQRTLLDGKDTDFKATIGENVDG